MSGGGLVARAFHDFGDVSDGAFYHDDVSWIVDRSVTAGCGGGNYRPNNNVTRGQMATFLRILTWHEVVNDESGGDDPAGAHRP